MPANRQQTPGFFDFMNTPSQRTTAALKDQTSTPTAEHPASKTSSVVGKEPTNLTSSVPKQAPLILTDSLKNLPENYNTANNSDTANNAILNPTVLTTGETNVLNKYRSYTYNFTLASLTSLDVNDPQRYRSSADYYVIAKSGGKGVNLIKGGNSPEDKSLIKSFNTQSPGRFDFFIDNVEIENLVAPSIEAGFSMPTSIRFDIIEPYSINGFIEAIHVSAVAAGYPTYTNASFLLKVEFTGYPDNKELPDPTNNIPKSSRYIPFIFTGIEVEVTERGTKYRCAGVPYEQKGFGHPNVLRVPTGMSGSTVESILQDLMKNLNEQVKNEDISSKKNPKNFDSYKIVFPSYVSSQGWTGTLGNNIGYSKVSELLRTNSVYKFRDPGNSDTNAGNYKAPNDTNQTVSYDWTHIDPKDPQVQFSEGAAIHDIISSVIRDSEYVREKLKNIKSSIKDGFMDYFMIRMEVKNLPDFDHSANKPYQEFTYVVTPYKIHYTRIPDYGSLKLDAKQLTTYAQRAYNYFYTGQNVDILNFKLNFNTLFFEAIPTALGNNDAVLSADSAAPSNTADLKTSGNGNNPPDANGRSSVKPVAQPIVPYGGAGQLPNYDPYAIMARNMHQALINSKASMITGEIDIIGDPFYLVTGGIGNYVPAPSTNNPRVTADGEADHNYGEVLIQIAFNNPIDIGTFEQGGLMQFDNSRAKFSGVYRVIKVQNTFHDGMFKQRLDIIRIPGQINNNDPIDDIGDRISTTKNPIDTTIPDTSNLPKKPVTVNINTK